MSYDFTKLSRVPVNDNITDNTYAIVANLDDIQKASLKAAVHTRDNYTDGCEAYIVSNPTKTPIDYIRTLSPLQPSVQNPNEYIRSGYIIFNDVYYIFDVYGDANHSYYDIIATDFGTNNVERYLFGSGSSTPPIVQYNYSDIEKHFVIEASGTTDDGNVTCNKTFAQIKDAIDNGFRIELRYSYGNSTLRDSSDWTVYQAFIKYSGGDVTQVTFSDLLNDGVSGIYKSIMFNFATGSSTPTIVIEDENIASLRSGKMDKSEPSGTGMLTLVDETNNDDYKFLRVYKENDDRAIEATFNPQGELIFNGSTEMFLSGLHVGLPTTRNEIANKQYVDNVAVSKVDNVDGTCKGMLSILKPVQSSTVLAPTLMFGENNDNKYIDISRIDEALCLSGFNNPNHFDPIIKGIGDPVELNDVANKQYVDNKANDLINDYVGRINSVINRTQSNSVCCIKRPYFFYDTDPQVKAYRFIGDSNIIPNIISTQEDTIVYIDITGQGIANNVEFLYAYYTLSNDEDVRYYNADVTYNRSNLNDYFIRVTIPNIDIQDNPYVSAIYIVYLQSTTDIELPELVALRNPYDSNQVISNYSTSTQYTEGSYCYYPNSTSGSLYICLSSTSGTWDSTKWLAVMARDSINKALQDRLRTDGSIAMTGNLNLNGTNKIINLATPTSGTDAANKNYVDSRGFTLDSNGILNFG